MAHIRKRTLADGSTAFRVIWDDPSGRRQSKQFSKATGPRPGDAARRFKVELENELRRGTYVDPRAGAVTFREYAEQWRAEQAHRSSSAERIEQSLRLHAYPTLGDMRISSVRQREIQSWLASLAVKPIDPRRLRPDATLAASTVRGVFDAVRAVFAAAVRERLIPESPCARVSPPRAERRRVVIPTPEQVEEIADGVLPWYRGFVQTAAGTGLRSGELRGLDTARLRVLDRIVIVDRQLMPGVGDPPVYGPPKSDASYRRVPLSQSYADAVAAHLAEFGTGVDGLVFTSKHRQPLRPQSITAAVTPVLRKVGFPRQIGMHLFRHFYASGLIAAGLDVLAVMRLLGHATVSETIGTYGHLWHDHEERTRTAIDAAFPARTSGPGEALSGHPRRSQGAATESARRHNRSGQVIEMRPSTSG